MGKNPGRVYYSCPTTSGCTLEGEGKDEPFYPDIHQFFSVSSPSQSFVHTNDALLSLRSSSILYLALKGANTQRGYSWHHSLHNEQPHCSEKENPEQKECDIVEGICGNTWTSGYLPDHDCPLPGCFQHLTPEL